jgi:hypothetical protein
MIRIAGILLISTIIYAFLIVDGKNELVRQVALATNPIFYNGTHMYGLDYNLQPIKNQTCDGFWPCIQELCILNQYPDVLMVGIKQRNTKCDLCESDAFDELLKDHTFQICYKLYQTCIVCCSCFTIFWLVLCLLGSRTSDSPKMSKFIVGTILFAFKIPMVPFILYLYFYNIEKGIDVQFLKNWLDFRVVFFLIFYLLEAIFVSIETAHRVFPRRVREVRFEHL